MPDSSTMQPWQIAAIVSLAGVIAFLFKLLWNKSEKGNEDNLRLIAARDAERIEWARKEGQIRTEHEERLREVVEEYSLNMKALHDDARKHEDAMRKEFAELMEAVSQKASEQAAALVTMLDKFYDRFVGPRPRY